jgi:hypothetical protein
MARLASLVAGIAALLLMLAGPASAAPIGQILIVPGDSSDLAAIRIRTSGGCPEKADAYYARLFGHGFPADGLLATPNTSAGLSHTAGFDVYFAQTMKDFAQDNNTTLTGRYDVVVYCIDSFTINSFGEFTGSLEFSAPDRYVALGAARPVGDPPPPIGVGEPVPIPPGGGEVPLSPLPGAPGAGGQANAAGPGLAPGDSAAGIDLLPILLTGGVVFVAIIVVAVVRSRRRAAAEAKAKTKAKSAVKSSAAAVLVLVGTAATAAILLAPGARPAAAEAGQPQMTIGVVIPTTTSAPPTTTTSPPTTTTEPTEPPTTGTTPDGGSPPVAGGSPGGGLSYTGSPAGILFAAGLALVAAGTAAVTAVRRRRTATGLTEGSS